MDSIRQIMTNVSDSIQTISAVPTSIIDSKHWWTNVNFPAGAECVLK